MGWSAGEWGRRVLEVGCWCLCGHGLLCRLGPFISYGETINEFDPWFNFRCSEYIRNNGFLAYLRWFDTKSWVPVGRSILHTTYPVFFLVSNLVHFAWDLFGVFRVSHYQLCCFMPVLYFLACAGLVRAVCVRVFAGDRLGRTKSCLAVALFSGSGGMLEKTVTGAFDYEGLSLALVLAIVLVHVRFLQREAKSGGGKGKAMYVLAVSLIQSVFAASWGGCIVTEVLLSAHTAALFENEGVLLAQTVGTFLVTCTLPFLRPVNIPLVGKLCTALGVMGVKRVRRADKRKSAVWGAVSFVAVLAAGFAGRRKAYPVVERFLTHNKIYNLFLRQKAHPLVASISEHRRPGIYEMYKLEGPFFFALPFMAAHLLWRARGKESYRTKLFVAIGGGTAALMFSCMERFAFLVSPFLSIIASDFVIGILHEGGNAAAEKKEQSAAGGRTQDTGRSENRKGAGAVAERGVQSRPEERKNGGVLGKEPEHRAQISEKTVRTGFFGRISNKELVSAVFLFAAKSAALCLLLVEIICAVTRCRVLSTSNVVVVMKANGNGRSLVVDDIREGAMYLKYNTPEDAVVVGWWDYGYQITGMSGRATVIDNNTNNYDRISEVAEMLLQPESAITSKYPLIREVKKKRDTEVFFYVLCGHVSKCRMCDLNKAHWITKIASEKNPRTIPQMYCVGIENKATVFLQSLLEMDPARRTVEGREIRISPALEASLLYRLSYFEYDPSISLQNFEMVHQTRSHMVRIYRLKS